MKQVVAPVISNSKITSDCYLMWLDSPEIAAEASPGQFIMVRCGVGDELLLRRPLSIHQRDDSKVALLFTVVGKGTAWLAQRKAGDKVDIFGPLGNGFSIEHDTTQLLLVAGGIGIAPLYFLAQEASIKDCTVTLLMGVQTKSQAYPERLLPEGIRRITATDDGTLGEKGMITDLLPRYIDWADQVFACGPVGMYQTMAQMPELKNKSVQVSLEVRMGCGRGVCYGCTIKTRQGLKKVCQDGPVFDLDDILWGELNQF